jgi:uncharacterized membrane protein (DUF106 family)
MRIIILPEVIDYFINLANILYAKGYLGMYFLTSFGMMGK